MMVEYFRDILKRVSWEAGDCTQMVGYDTQVYRRMCPMFCLYIQIMIQFQVGPYYVSTLTGRDPQRIHRVSKATMVVPVAMVS